MTEQLTLSTNVPHIKNTEVLVECKYIVLKIIIFCFVLFKIYLFMVVLGLHCSISAFSSCSEWGLLCSLGAWASYCNGFSC